MGGVDACGRGRRLRAARLAGAAALLLAAGAALSSLVAGTAFGSEAAARDTAVSLPGPAVPNFPEDATAAIAASTTSPQVGTPFTVTVTVSTANGINPGGVLVTGIDPLLTVQSQTSSAGHCTILEVADYSCPFGVMLPATQATVTFTLLPVAAGTVDLGAAVTGPQPSATHTVMLTNGDLSLTVAAPSATFGVSIPGGRLSVAVAHAAKASLTVAADGTAAIGSGTVKLTIPADVRLVALTAHGGTCTLRPAKCSFSGLAPGATASIVARLQGRSVGTGRLVAVTSGTLAGGVVTGQTASAAVVVPKPKPKPRPKRR
jgi:hypothetical protein